MVIILFLEKILFYNDILLFYFIYIFCRILYMRDLLFIIYSTYKEFTGSCVGFLFLLLKKRILSAHPTPYQLRYYINKNSFSILFYPITYPVHLSTLLPYIVISLSTTIPLSTNIASLIPICPLSCVLYIPLANKKRRLLALSYS